MASADPGATGSSAGAAYEGYGRLERLCEIVCEVVLVAMLALIGTEALARSVFHVALESADEFGGYCLVAISFLSLSTCQVTGAFHSLELIQARLSPRGHAISALVFDLLSFAFSAILLWQLTRLTWNTWSHGDVAQTEWVTPLWMPMLTMPLGAAALSATLIKVLIADIRRLQACGEAAMTPLVEIAVVFAVFLALLAAGMKVPFAIGVPGLVYLLLHGGLPALKGLGLVSWGSMNSFTLTAMPLFILMAELIQRSGLSSRTYRGLARLVSPIPGGLLQTNIASCALFAAINGSSVATAATIGSVAYPELKKRNYKPSLATGSLAAGGTLGILIPPSLAMIVYGSFTETSVAKLFMAGVIPGLLLTAMFMAYIAVHAILRPQDTPRERGPRNRAEALSAVVDLLPFVFLIGGTMSTLYFGIATPTEAAALGCLMALVFSKIWGVLTWADFRESLRSTVRSSGNLLFIIYTAYIFAYAISVAGVGEQVTSFIVGLKLSRFEFFLVLFLLYTVLGCLVESLGMIVITVPLLFPVLLKYGIDPVWFGIILVLFIEMGQISPPIGINLFVIQSISKVNFGAIVLGTIPFHLLILVLLVLLVFFPELALWLPSQMSAR